MTMVNEDGTLYQIEGSDWDEQSEKELQDIIDSLPF
jgi:hypothetical protein